MTRPLSIVSDDIPAAFLRDMLFNRGTAISAFSEEDAVLEAEADNRRSPHPRHYRSPRRQLSPAALR